jgi:hypothetical protein
MILRYPYSLSVHFLMSKTVSYNNQSQEAVLKAEGSDPTIQYIEHHVG